MLNVGFWWTSVSGSVQIQMSLLELCFTAIRDPAGLQWILVDTYLLMEASGFEGALLAHRHFKGFKYLFCVALYTNRTEMLINMSDRRLLL